MRTGLSTIQQTLTPEAASVLNHSIAEAGRRNHGQTTPLHVAATLLASPSGFLRQACIKSHPNSSHPLQCRALELCFSVALERLPTSQSTNPSAEPPISNALMAALKRAQAHQRRGYPEQQQQPLLAVKVELEQLIISILDDPSVSRVMREASFSSPAVKATIEQSLNSASPAVNSGPIGLGFRPGVVSPAAPASARSLYLNPRLQQAGAGATAVQLGGQNQRGDEVKKAMDILMRRKKRNPILVGESELEATLREVLRKIENKELGEGAFGIVGFNPHVVNLEKDLPSDKAQIPGRLKELGDLIESRVGSGRGGVFVNLGDLKWLVEQPVGFGGGHVQQVTVAEAGRAVVAEMGRLVAKFGGEGGSGRLWLLGTATCETYLRCQVYHPSMENDWDLQAVPITSRAPLPRMFPRLGSNGILGASLESLSPLKAFPTTAIAPPRRASENVDPAGVSGCCPQCMQNYEKELVDILKEKENSDAESKPEASRPPLPQWLQKVKTNNDNAKVVDQSNGQEVDVKKRTQELQKKWQDACLNSHPKFHQQSLSTERITPTPFSMTGLYSVNLLGRQLQPKIPLNKNLGSSLQLSPNPTPVQPPEPAASPLPSPVTTELVLGQTKPSDTTNPEETCKERISDFLNCMSAVSHDKFDELKSKKLLDADSFKRLLKGLTEKVWWQQDAASAVATTVTQCKLGNGKKRQVGAKGDMWLLFLGPDRVGKKKMAAALSELVSASSPIVISLAHRRGDGDSDVHLRGKTALDRIAEAIRRNPQSVIMLEDIDEANILIRGSLKRAMEQGRFADSHGREISLGNVMFILTANWLPEDLSYLSSGTSLDEEKLAKLGKGGWQLRLSLAKRASKRRPSWLSEEDRSLKPRKETNLGLSFDLNEAADAEEDRGDGSLNSSDLTVDHEDNHVLHNVGLQTASASVPRELLDAVDDAIVFKPLNFNLLCASFSASISKRFSTIAGNGVSIEVQERALEKIASGVWVSQTNITEWMEKVLVPSFHQIKKSLNSCANDHESSLVVRLEDDGYSDRQSSEERLPATVRVVAEEY